MNARTSKKELVVLYLRFRSLLDSINGLPDASIITPELDTLLAVIGTAWHSGKPLAVRKLLIREELGSPATIHKRIHQLKDAGFVSFEGKEGDSRVRLVVPTEQALRYFAEHAKVIQQAAK
jgi:DNA-binding MarR family transcriptional regulator